MRHTLVSTGLLRVESLHTFTAGLLQSYVTLLTSKFNLLYREWEMIERKYKPLKQELRTCGNVR